MSTPKYVPTPEQAALDAAVAARKAKLEAQGHANAVEQRESVVASPDTQGVHCLKDLLPEAVETFRRLEERGRKFLAGIRADFDADPCQSIPCEIHRDVARPLDFDLTVKETRLRDRYTPAYGPCLVCEAQSEADHRRDFWSRRGVPARVIDASFRNFDTSGEASAEKQRALGDVRAWYRRRGIFLLLTGSPGTGKGHLAAACLRNNGAGLWIEHVAMLGDLRASYTLHTTNDLIATWQEAEMLVLDEFGLSPGGKDEEPMLYQVLAERYDKRRATIITSNLDRQPLRDAIGYRLLDRIREDCTSIQFRWTSHRTPKASPQDK